MGLGNFPAWFGSLGCFCAGLGAAIGAITGNIARGRGLGAGLAGGRAEIRKNGMLLHLTLAQGGEVIGDGIVFIESDVAGVGADETFVENAAGKLVKAFVLEGAEHAGADLSGVGDGVERDAAVLALLAKFFSEGSHGCSGGRGQSPSALSWG